MWPLAAVGSEVAASSNSFLGISGDTQADRFFSALKGDFSVQEVKSLIAAAGQMDPQNQQINVTITSGICQNLNLN